MTDAQIVAAVRFVCFRVGSPSAWAPGRSVCAGATWGLRRSPRGRGATLTPAVRPWMCPAGHFAAAPHAGRPALRGGGAEPGPGGQQRPAGAHACAAPQHHRCAARPRAHVGRANRQRPAGAHAHVSAVPLAVVNRRGSSCVPACLAEQRRRCGGAQRRPARAAPQPDGLPRAPGRHHVVLAAKGLQAPDRAGRAQGAGHAAHDVQPLISPPPSLLSRLRGLRPHAGARSARASERAARAPGDDLKRSERATTHCFCRCHSHTLSCSVRTTVACGLWSRGLRGVAPPGRTSTGTRLGEGSAPPLFVNIAFHSRRGQGDAAAPEMLLLLLLLLAQACCQVAIHVCISNGGSVGASFARRRGGGG